MKGEKKRIIWNHALHNSNYYQFQQHPLHLSIPRFQSMTSCNYL